MKNKRKKRILLVTQYFYPETFKVNDIAFELSKDCYDVTVLCGIPNYPKGKYFKGYHIFKNNKEVINGVTIHRLPIIPRGSNKIMLALNYMSFVVLGCIWGFFLSLKYKYDIVFVHAVSPITQAIPGILVKRITKAPLYLWVLDIWPDAMTSGGGITNKLALNIMDILVKYIYRKSDKILISSKRFSESISSKGDFDHKVEYFPNWSDDFYLSSKNARFEELKQLIPKGFVIMMAGNLGKSQDIISVLKAAKITADRKSIKWVFIGDGSMRQKAEEYVKDNRLDNSVYFLGRHLQEEMKYFYACADVMLLTLRSEFPHLKMVVPARLQSYMSAGKPIVGMIDGGASDLIREADCGLSVPAGDFKALANLVKELSQSENSDFARNARHFYLQNFTKYKCIGNLKKIITSRYND